MKEEMKREQLAMHDGVLTNFHHHQQLRELGAALCEMLRKFETFTERERLKSEAEEIPDQAEPDNGVTSKRKVELKMEVCKQWVEDAQKAREVVEALKLEPDAA